MTISESHPMPRRLQSSPLRTGIRSQVKLQIGSGEPYTAMVLDSATKSVISEAIKTKDTKRVRIGLGYGRIRAGVAEGAPAGVPTRKQPYSDQPVAKGGAKGRIPVAAFRGLTGLSNDGSFGVRPHGGASVL